MKTHAAIALLLTFCLGAMPAAAQPRLPQENVHEKITPAEEREALEVAESLLKRLEDEQDISPLLDEMFVGNFAERLHERAGSGGSLYFLDRRVAAQASRDEVRNYYVAFNNLILLTSLYYVDAELTARADNPNKEDETETAELKLEDIFPPEVLELFRNDSFLGRFVIAEEEREAGTSDQIGEGAKPTEDEDEFIETVEQLRDFTSTVERANSLLRRRLTRHQTERVFKEWRSAAGSEESTLMRPRLTILPTEWYGYTEGTRVICVNVLIFHVDLVRVEDQYKVLALYLEDD